MALEAGTGVRDISPLKPVFLAGYPHIERISTGVHDPLLACALYLKNENKALILVAVDILFISPSTARTLRQTIAEETGVNEKNIFISCSHTHSGPVTVDMLAWQDDAVVPGVEPEYIERLEKGIIEAACESFRSMRSAEIAWMSTQAEGVGGNRYAKDGVCDPEVGILAVRDSKTKNMSGLLVIYSMHPTVLHEDSRLVSADFPAFTRQYLKENIHPDLTVLYHTGPAGNQSPRYHVKSQTLDEAERLGCLLGEAVTKRMAGLKKEDFGQDIIIEADIAHVTLYPRTFPSLKEAQQNLEHCRRIYENLKKQNAGHGPVRTAECAVFGAEGTVCLARLQEGGQLSILLERYKSAEVQVVRMGNCFIAGLPGELFVEYGLMLKKKAPAKTFVISLANGELQGYIVTPEAAREGGYEASNSIFKPESGEAMVNTALELIARMQ